MKYLCFAALAFSVCGGSAFAACTVSGEIGSPTMSVRYDPFYPAQQTVEMKAAFRNAGDSSCPARLYLRPVNGAQSLVSAGDSLLYRLEGSTGSGTPRAGELGPYVTFVPPRDSAELLVRIVVPAHQIVARGYYLGQLELRADDDVGNEIRVAGGPISIQADVPARAGLSISGTTSPRSRKGAMAPASIDYPNAQTGQTNQVFVNVWANSTVTVSLTSEEGGVLRHVDNAALPPIQYTATFNGRPLSLETATAFDESPPMTVTGGSYGLLVTLGDTSKKYAGRYRDVITVSVNEN